MEQPLPAQNLHLDRSLPFREPRLQSVKMQSLPQRIAEAIIQAAAEGKFALGERLIEPNLARELGVSRVPVREALRILESQGIAVASINHGMRLMTLGGEKLTQLLQVRVALEKLVLESLMKRQDEVWQSHLANALLNMKTACDAADARRVAESDLGFHRALFVGAKNEIALEFWGNISNRLRIIMGVAASSKAGRLRTNFSSYYDYHVGLFNRILTGDISKALTAIEEHILEPSQWLSVHKANQGLPPDSTQVA